MLPPSAFDSPAAPLAARRGGGELSFPSSPPTWERAGSRGKRRIGSGQLPSHRASLEMVVGLDHIADRLTAVRNGKPGPRLGAGRAGRACSFWNWACDTCDICDILGSRALSRLFRAVPATLA